MPLHTRAVLSLLPLLWLTNASGDFIVLVQLLTLHCCCTVQPACNRNGRFLWYLVQLMLYAYVVHSATVMGKNSGSLHFKEPRVSLTSGVQPCMHSMVVRSSLLHVTVTLVTLTSWMPQLRGEDEYSITQWVHDHVPDFIACDDAKWSLKASDTYLLSWQCHCSALAAVL